MILYILFTGYHTCYILIHSRNEDCQNPTEYFLQDGKNRGCFFPEIYRKRRMSKCGKEMEVVATALQI